MLQLPTPSSCPSPPQKKHGQRVCFFSGSCEHHGLCYAVLFCSCAEEKRFPVLCCLEPQCCPLALQDKSLCWHLFLNQASLVIIEHLLWQVPLLLDALRELSRERFGRLVLHGGTLSCSLALWRLLRFLKWSNHPLLTQN